MAFFQTYGELHGTAYVHHPPIADAADDGQDSRVRDAWYGELMKQRRDEQRMNAGRPHVEKITFLTVWPGRLGGHMRMEDVKPYYPGADTNYPRSLAVLWPPLSTEQGLLLAAAARPPRPPVRHRLQP